MAFLEVNFFSETLGMCTAMNVVLPQRKGGRSTQVDWNADGTYPVLYLLHGMSDDQTIWCRRTSIERYADEKGIAVIMPTTHLGWYTDMKHGFRYFTFLTEELPAICHDFFPNLSQRREDTFVAGLSMGGYGALKCGICAPEKFSAAAALSAATDSGWFVSDSLKHNPQDHFWTDIFGTPDENRGSINDLFAQAEKHAQEKDHPKFYMWCGESDTLLGQNRAMHEHLVKLGYDVTYEESPGDHQWKYWDEKIQTVLNWIPLRKKG